MGCAQQQQAPATPLLPPESNKSCKASLEVLRLTDRRQGLNHLRLGTFPKVSGHLASAGTKHRAHRVLLGHGAGRQSAQETQESESVTAQDSFEFHHRAGNYLEKGFFLFLFFP